LSRVYLHGLFDPARATRGLGTEWEFDRLSIKPYPTCRLTHPAISAALDLHAQLGRETEKIERVELVIGPQAHDVVGREVSEKRTPQTRVNAQFSVYWSVASALAYGEVSPRQLAEEVPPSPKLAEWIRKISGTPDPAAAQRDVGGCKLRAYGAFGTREVDQTSAKGHPDNPLSDDELLAKFKANLRYAKVSDGQAAELADAIMAIDSLSDLRALADAIAGAVA
jgi:2-methylcitrate dehydratase PrpD